MEDMTPALRKNDYHHLVEVIGATFEQGQKHAVSVVNQVLTETYWLIGRHIVEYEQKGEARAQYGDQLLVQLS